MYSLLHTIEPGQPVARKIGRTAKPGRFRGTRLFLSDGSYPMRGICYSLVIHVALISVLVAAPNPTTQPTDLAGAELLQIEALLASGSASNISSADIAPQLEAALEKDAHQTSPGARCCSPQTIISNLPNATNRVQTILQPDFADRPPLEKFVPLPDMLKFAPVSLGSARHARASNVSPPQSLERDLEAMQFARVLPVPIVPVLAAPRRAAPSTIEASSAPKDSQPAQERLSQRSGGDDPHNVLALSVVSAPPSDVLPIPMGESRGQFVILAPPNPTAPDRESGDAATSKASGGHKRMTAAHSESRTNRSEPAHAGKPDTAIPDASSVGAANPFAGITIQGGEWDRDSRAMQPSARDARPDESEISSYPLIITSTGNSGGGLRDFGVFYNQMAYTIYFTVERFKRPYVPPFVLQFAVNQPCCAPSNVVTPPHPENEVLPSWPEGAMAPFTGEMVVVYGVISEDGKIRDARVLESPSADLNGALLDALAQWTFRPAAINGQPAAAKALLGVPVVPYE
jgi:TonB family protein